MAFYDKFEMLCDKKMVTPTQAARDIGVTQQSVSLWKKRGSTPKAQTVQKIADYFGVSIDSLLDTKPLPPQKHWSEDILSPDEQEVREISAVNTFLAEIGYDVTIESEHLRHFGSPGLTWILCDERENKRYFLSGRDFCSASRKT